MALGGNEARAALCDASKQFCGYWHGSSSSSSGAPTQSSKINLNPSAVPIEKGVGAEVIYFDNSFDFALVKGLGRVGAAISPSNNEETFFGPPGIELPEDLQNRKSGKHKFPAQKWTLATSFGLIDNRSSGLERFETN